MKLMHVLIARLGARVLAIGHDVLGVLGLARKAVSSYRDIEWRSVIHHAYTIGNRSILFVALIMAFTGAIMTLQVAEQSLRILGDMSRVGPAFLQLLVREFGPTIVALMIAARSGAAMAAELGSYTITEQVDAARMAGVEPWGYWVGSRVLGSLIAMIPVVVWGSFVAFMVGGFALLFRHHVGWDTYFNLSMTQGKDLAVGLLKTLAYAAVIPLVACYYGLAARGGAPGVGRATTQAVIGASVGILLVDLILGALAHLV